MASQFCGSTLDLAKIFDVSERTIDRWRRDGAPSRTSRGWSITSWKKWRKERDTKDGYKRRERGPVGVSVRDRKELAEAIIKELKAEQLAGTLVRRDSVIRTWSKYINYGRQILKALPETVAILIQDVELRHVVRQETERIVSNVLCELEEGSKLDGVS